MLDFFFKEKKWVLYHGSVFKFNSIDLSRGKPYKDFGKGFYTTRDRNHAINLALRNKKIEEMRIKQKNYNSTVTAYIYSYELDVIKIKDLSVKEFKSADKEWVLFVLANRKSPDKTHSYDIVIGPTANDDTKLSLRAYFAGAYGELESDKAINTLLDNIEPDNLPPQIYFGSNKGIELLLLKEGAVAI